MQLLILLFACLGCSLAAPRDEIGLSDDLLQFCRMLGQAGVYDIVANSLETDPAIAAVHVYLQSEQFNTFVDQVMEKPVASYIYDFMRAHALYFFYIFDLVQKYVASITPGIEPDGNASLRPFLDEAEAAFPLGNITDFAYYKLNSSADFRTMHTLFASEEGKAFVDEVLAMDEAIFIHQQLIVMEVDVAAVTEAVWRYFEWGEPPTEAPTDAPTA